MGNVCSGEAADDGCSSPCFTSIGMAVKADTLALAGEPGGSSVSGASCAAVGEVGRSY